MSPLLERLRIPPRDHRVRTTEERRVPAKELRRMKERDRKQLFRSLKRVPHEMEVHTEAPAP